MRSLHLGLTFDTFTFVTDLSLEPAVNWFNSVVAMNERSRARDAGKLPLQTFRIACPLCGAGLHFLTTVEVQGIRVRACRSCRGTFPLEEHCLP